MITNNHIAMQLAVERQRDLRGGSGVGWRLPHVFARPALKRDPGHGVPDAVARAEAAPEAVPRERVVTTQDPHLPEPRIRRTPAGQSAAWTPAPRCQLSARESEHAGS